MFTEIALLILATAAISVLAWLAIIFCMIERRKFNRGLAIYNKCVDGQIDYDTAMAQFREAGIKIPSHW